MRSRCLAGLGVFLLLTPPAVGFAPIPANPPPVFRVLPPCTVFVAHVNAASLFAKDLARGLSPLLATSCEREFGVPPDQLRSITWLRFKESGVTLAVTRLPYERRSVLQAATPHSVELTFKQQKFHGYPFKDYRKAEWYGGKLPPLPPDPAREAGADPERPAVCFLSDHVLIKGPARGVIHFLMKAERLAHGHPLVSSLAAADRNDLTVGFGPLLDSQDHSATELKPRDESGPRNLLGIVVGALSANLKPLLAARRGVLTANLSGETRLDVSMVFPDARSARLGADGLRLALLMAKGSLLMLEEQMPEPFAPLRPDSAVLASLERLKASLDRAVIQADGFTVKASVRVKTPPDVVKTVLAETAAGVQLIANRNAAEHNLEQLAVAVLEYTEDHKDRMPPSILRSRAGKPLHSWRVLILPYIGHKGLHDRLKLDEPWDSAHNKPLLARMPKVFELPGVKAQEGMTFFQVFEGAYANSDRHRAFAVNGSSNTLLIAEAANAVHWAEPIDIPYSDHVSPVTQLGSHLGPFSLCAFGDTQVRRFANVSEANLRQLIKPVYKRGFRD